MVDENRILELATAAAVKTRQAFMEERVDIISAAIRTALAEAKEVREMAPRAAWGGMRTK